MNEDRWTRTDQRPDEPGPLEIPAAAPSHDGGKDLPRIVVTGASGFLGRHLLERIKDRYRIFAIARRSQARCGAPVHENITWLQADIADAEMLGGAFDRIRRAGGAEVVIHLAAHYDFTGEESPEYWRTNVEGLRNVLEACRPLRLRRFVFASSVAACPFPPPGQAVDETTAPDGDHLYAVTKRIGEAMLAEYAPDFRSCIVRFAALFSDWCEYPPLYAFLETWLSTAWNSRILAGRGESAIPYLHVRDAARFLHLLLERIDLPLDREVLVCSTDGAVSHRELHELATLAEHGERARPILLPRWLCRAGVWSRDMLGRVLGNRPFERPWMVRYIDRRLTVDASRTRIRLGWIPRARLEIGRRMPFLIEHRKTEPVEWHRRNRAAMKHIEMRPNLLIYKVLEKYQQSICERVNEVLESDEAGRLFPRYRAAGPERLSWRHTVALRNLMNAVRTAEKAVFLAYCRDLAARRHAQGVPRDEVCRALELLHQVCLAHLLEDPELERYHRAVHDHVTMTFQFACDQVAEVYENLDGEP